MAYAEKTSVPVERSRAELERILARYGATSFAYAQEPGRAGVVFQTKERRVRFVLALPDRGDARFQRVGVNQFSTVRATAQQAERAWEQACRQRWRALVLVVQAKLEAIEAGISSFDLEFGMHTVLPSGETLGEWAAPYLAGDYELGAMPPVLALGPGS